MIHSTEDLAMIIPLSVLIFQFNNIGIFGGNELLRGLGQENVSTSFLRHYVVQNQTVNWKNSES